jgi:hypothetical protein
MRSHRRFDGDFLTVVPTSLSTGGLAVGRAQAGTPTRLGYELRPERAGRQQVAIGVASRGAALSYAIAVSAPRSRLAQSRVKVIVDEPRKPADLLGIAEGVTFPRVLGIECVGVGDLAVAVPSARVESGF